MSVLLKARAVDRLSPQAEWRLVHRLADAAIPTIIRSLQRALTSPEVATSWTRVTQHLANGDGNRAVMDVDLEPLAKALQDKVWPSINAVYQRAGEIVARQAGQRGILRKAKNGARVTMSFDVTNPHSVGWAERHAARLVTQVTDETRKAVRALVVESFADQITPRQLAKQMRQVVGLTQRQALSLQHKRASFVAEGLDSATIERRIERAANVALRDRSMLIARTETIAAANAGQTEAWRQGRSEGLIDIELVKEWITTPDDRTCPECEPLDGEQRLLDHPFTGGVMEPPLHPDCRCAVGLVPPSTPDVVQSTKLLRDDLEVLSQPSEAFTPIRPNELETLGRFATEGVFTKERVRLHDAIVRTFVAEGAPVKKPTVTILGGGPASGKSTIKGQLNVPKGAINVDVDEVRRMLPEFNEMVAAKQLDDAAAFTHAESSRVAKRIVKETSSKYHLVIDGTGDGDYDELSKKIAGYRKQGQRITAHYVTVDTDEAVRRMLERAARPGPDFGRKVGVKVLKEIHAGVSQVLPRAMADGLFDEATLWDTNGIAPLKVATSGRAGKITIHDETAWQRFLKKGEVVKTLAVKATVDTDVLVSLFIDVVLGRSAPANESKARAEMRAIFEREVAEMRRNGDTIVIPGDLP